MKEVTIPEIGANPLVVEIGNSRTEYKAGETYEVEDAVAEVIENMIASFPQEGTPNIPVVAPKVTAEDIGKAVVVGEDGNFTFGEAGGEVIVDIDPINETASMSSDEIVAELRKGKKVIGYTYMEDMDEPGDYSMTYYNVTFVQYVPTLQDESQRCLVSMTSLQADPMALTIIIDGAKHCTVNEYQLQVAE